MRYDKAVFNVTGQLDLRFDDSLDTVLTADLSTPLGVQSAWRQLVDLIGRARVPVTDREIERLRSIRPHVPATVRAASGRALAFAYPPAALVQLFAEEDISISAPVLRMAVLPADRWIEMLGVMTPAGRSLLRHRRDLPEAVVRALEAFGPTDFILPPSEIEPEQELSAQDIAAADAPTMIDWAAVVAARPAAIKTRVPPPANQVAPLPSVENAAAPAQATSTIVDPQTDQSFVSIASVAFGLPVVVEAIRQQGNASEGEDGAMRQEAEAPGEAASAPVIANDTQPAEPRGPFQISDLVARIDAFQKQREAGGSPTVTPLVHAPLRAERAPDRFQFETDAAGLIRWVAGVSRTAMIGVSLDGLGAKGVAQVDGIASGAFRRRAGFADARLVIDGASDAAGQWRISAVPVFDDASGRFTGYRGTGRRPRPDERAERSTVAAAPAADSLRQLVHELRTPTTAIAGFAEMIEGALLGPVPPAYRDYASTIKGQAMGLLGAIDDLDMAARIEAHALDLRPIDVPIGTLLRRIRAELAPLASLRGAEIALVELDDGDMVHGDDRAVDRLLSRLMAVIVSASSPGELIAIRSRREGDDVIATEVTRPKALAGYRGDALLTIDGEADAEAEGAPLLGTGFALRLARNLAVELGGSLSIGAERLTLRLPAALCIDMGHASTI